MTTEAQLSSATPSVPSPQSSVLSPVSVRGFYAMHLPAACLPLVAAALLYGWAGLATVAVLLASVSAALLLWSRIGRRGRQLSWPRCLWEGLLLAMILPPHLLAPGDWPIVPAAGAFLVMIEWLLGGIGSGRVHRVPLAYLLLVVLFYARLSPHLVLRPDHVLMGNLFNSQPLDPAQRTDPWIAQTRRGGAAEGKDAFDDPDPAAVELSEYTSGRDQPDRFTMSPQMLLRDKMPPLEDLVLGGEPGAIGTSCALAVIVGGLFLIYQGLIDCYIPLLALAVATVGFLVLPVPVVITDLGPTWRWLVFRQPYLGWPAAVTLANYELFASPLLFVVFFLATSPHSRPMSRRACAAYGILLGLLAAPAQLYGSVFLGPFVALLPVALTSRTLDRLFPPRTLV
jgi:Na+-translocating ferredoxin:NAD+ oxidoreductase RnfD subunit